MGVPYYYTINTTSIKSSTYKITLIQLARYLVSEML